MTVGELMCTFPLRKASVLAGGEGMNRSITWYVSDIMFQLLLKEKKSIVPGIVVLHAGSSSFLNDSNYIEWLKEQEVAGVFVLGDQKENFKDWFHFFDQEKIPLIHIENETNVLNFTKQIASVLSSDSNEELRQEEWLKRVSYSNDSMMNQHMAKCYGYCSSAKYACIISKAKDSKEKNIYQLEYDMRWLKRVMEESFICEGVKPLQFIDNDELVSFIPIAKDEKRNERQKRIENEIARIRKKLAKRRKFKIAVSLDGRSMDGFAQSLQKARKTAVLIEALKVHEPVSCYENWSMHMLLLREPHTQLKDYVEQVLGTLCNDKELLETLTMYLSSGESLKNTADFLYIHTNTLKYRLDKISKILECDLKEAETRFRLRMAITVYRYLDNNGYFDE